MLRRIQQHLALPAAAAAVRNFTPMFPSLFAFSLTCNWPQDAPGHVVALDTRDDALESVGGKGRSLARMTNSGVRVPDGFIVRTRCVGLLSFISV